MSKKIDKIIIAPGEHGWEIWKSSAEHGFELHASSEVLQPIELENIPSGEITFLFPVKAVTAIPMRVASDDESLFPDLASLHAERLGLRPDPMAGQLTDLFVIAREAENTALVYLVLRAPEEDELPLRGPKHFDVSSRTLVTSGDQLTVWKELGRWVFAIHHEGGLVYSQATSISSVEPNEVLVREIRLALIQLSLQGIEMEPERVVMASSVADVGAGALAGAFPGTFESRLRTAPVLPELPSKLLPDDVRAARRAARKRGQIQLAIAAVVLLYLGLITWYGIGLYMDKKETKNLMAEAQASAPERAEFNVFNEKWNELEVALKTEYSPVDIMNRVNRTIPPNSRLRLKTAEITPTEIRLIGDAPQASAVNAFNLALTRSNDLLAYTWENPDPVGTSRGWEFTFTGTSTPK